MSIDELLLQLQATYLKSLPGKFENIEKVFLSGDLKALRTEFHKIKGTGLTYGLGEISEVGERVELICIYRPEQLERAVPLALKVLGRIYESRTRGETPLIDQDADFQSLAELAKGLDGLIR